MGGQQSGMSKETRSPSEERRQIKERHSHGVACACCADHVDVAVIKRAQLDTIWGDQLIKGPTEE